MRVQDLFSVVFRAGSGYPEFTQTDIGRMTGILGRNDRVLPLQQVR